MKNIFTRRALGFLPIMLWPGWIFGQLAVTLKFDHAETIQRETVWARIEIHNKSPDPFVVARDVARPPRLEFTLVKESGREAARTSANPILRNIYILPGGRESLRIPVSQWYALAEMGHYLARATVEWNGEFYESNAALLGVVRGMELTRSSIPMPGYPRQMLECSLRYWPRNREEHLFMVIENRTADMHYGAFPLGPLLRIERPRIEVTEDGFIRTVHQSSPNCYTHAWFKVEPEAVSLARQAFMTRDGKPCATTPAAGHRP